ncbi:kinase-like domain-containing protein [Syncephalastrum racemosum]|uniref:Kinase-like domain-containing protein n=1 Tax=Syncephalastrum racemosum TaxID=13706 RepID=A0A1X2HJ23_SYNRA|nr:kinase-like domain-containing protein [Syncephalastrum racemosum]
MTEHVATFFRRFSHPPAPDLTDAKDPPVSHRSLPTHPHSPTLVMSPHNSSTSSGSEELEPVSAFGPPSSCDPRTRSDPLNPVKALTVDLRQVYTVRNPKFHHDIQKNPRRILTKPSEPRKNDGYDNENGDYILYVNGILGPDPNNQYIILDMLGSGTFGQVVKCRHQRTNRLVGIKIIKNKPAYIKQSRIEVDILTRLNRDWDPQDNHHILRLLDTFTHKHHLCLVFELLSVNLYELIKQNRFSGLSTNLIRVFTKQLVETLEVLKHSGTIHCDLKPENILLESLESPKIKVIDFGSACHQSEQMYTYIQSRFYRSPEVILGLKYSTAIDMWSFGCIVAELFLGLPLFPGSSEYNQISRIFGMLGPPPTYMIEKGRFSHRYFNRVEEDGRVCYVMKSRRQYSHERHKTEKPSRQYFSAHKLDELIMTYPMPRKHMSHQEKDREMEQRAILLDFLQRVLQIDPLRRMTPREAKQHPFLKRPSHRTPVSDAASYASDKTSNTYESEMANSCICSVSRTSKPRASEDVDTPPLSPLEEVLGLRSATNVSQSNNHDSSSSASERTTHSGRAGQLRWRQQHAEASTAIM